MIRPTLIYLAGPIDDVLPEEARGWREQVAADNPTLAFFSPIHGFFNDHTTTIKAIDLASRHVIACSDAMLANLSGPGRGFGTIREVEFAVRLGKTVVVVGEIESLLTYDVSVVGSLDEAIQEILDILANKRDEQMTLPRFLGIHFDESGDDGT